MACERELFRWWMTIMWRSFFFSRAWNTAHLGEGNAFRPPPGRFADRSDRATLRERLLGCRRDYETLVRAHGAGDCPYRWRGIGAGPRSGGRPGFSAGIHGRREPGRHSSSALPLHREPVDYRGSCPLPLRWPRGGSNWIKAMGDNAEAHGVTGIEMKL